MRASYVRDHLLESAAGYRLWMAPFADQKFAPVKAHNDLAKIRRVLDVGCGPGTNAEHFAHTEYLGMDLNPGYVERAKQRYGREFRAVDVTQYEADEGERSDFIFLNSLLHHLDTTNVQRILAHLATLLTPDGHLHVIELILPERRSIARRLARWDRGDYPRSLGGWRQLLEEDFDTVVFEEYRVGMPGIDLWHLLYFKGRSRLHCSSDAEYAPTAQVM